MRARDPHVLVTVARGSSDHAASFLKYAVELTAGIPVASVGPSVASIYGAQLRLKGAACLAISQSGKSPDIVAMAEAARRGGALTVAITNTPASPLAAASDHTIDIMAGAEKSVAATKTFVNSALAGLALMAHATEDAALLAALEALPGHFEKAIGCDWTDARGALASASSLFILGRGPSVAIANEAALKFKETCGMHAEAYSAAEVMHGPLALVTPGFPVLALAARDRSEPSMAETADALGRQAGRGVRHLRPGQSGGAAAFCRDRPPADRPAGADRLLLCLRRGVRPPARARSRRAAQPEEGDGNAMSRLVAILGARIFDGEAWHRDAALLVRDGRVEAVGPAVPREAELVRLDGGIAVGGLRRPAGERRRRRDAQRAAGRGDDPHDLRGACAYGTTALLPTLITDTPAVTVAAVEAGAEAARHGVAGFAGLHLEGPHLSQARKGAHDPELIRPMTDADEAFLVAARRRLPALLATVAPESVTPERIGRWPPRASW